MGAIVFPMSQMEFEGRNHLSFLFPSLAMSAQGVLDDSLFEHTNLNFLHDSVLVPLATSLHNPLPSPCVFI